MQTPTTTEPGGALGAVAPVPTGPRVVLGAEPRLGRPLFPPKDADEQARRRWLASSPWPEVVFAAAL